MRKKHINIILHIIAALLAAWTIVMLLFNVVYLDIDSQYISDFIKKFNGDHFNTGFMFLTFSETILVSRAMADVFGVLCWMFLLVASLGALLLLINITGIFKMSYNLPLYVIGAMFLFGIIYFLMGVIAASKGSFDAVTMSFKYHSATYIPLLVTTLLTALAAALKFLVKAK